MKFSLKKPCKDCPFRKDKPHHKGWLGKDRAKEIYNNLLDGGLFPCTKHMTIHKIVMVKKAILSTKKTTSFVQVR